MRRFEIKSAFAKPAAAAVLGAGLLAAGMPVKAALDTPAWKLIEFPGIDPSRFVRSADGRIDVLSDNSSAMLYRELRPAEKTRRFISWRWRVDTAPPATDLTRRGGDRPLAIHVCFAAKPADRGLFGWMERALISDRAAMMRGARCLTYVWGGRADRGAAFPNPYLTDRGYVFVLRGAQTPTGEWFMEKIDCARDYRKAFSEPPAAPPAFIAISGDSDGTESRAAGSVAGIVFSDS